MSTRLTFTVVVHFSPPRDLRDKTWTPPFSGAATRWKNLDTPNSWGGGTKLNDHGNNIMTLPALQFPVERLLLTFFTKKA